jgi:hypothetical protein
MIEITEGFTRISAGCDSIEGTNPRVPTGARVTVEFRRETSLGPAQEVRVRYEFAGDGQVREGTGVAKPIRKIVRWGGAVHYDYRMSHWIEPAAVMRVAAHGASSYTQDSQTLQDSRRTHALDIARQ